MIDEILSEADLSFYWFEKMELGERLFVANKDYFLELERISGVDDIYRVLNYQAEVAKYEDLC